MLDLSWKVFSKTGNLDTYLIIKQIERDSIESEELDGDERETADPATF
ncbi:YqzL family protein [Shouchella shacheensis]|nr:YqzL family protein [Shouchella shacheensis]